MPDPDPPIRSGARTTHRRGRMTDARLAILAELGPRWMLPAETLDGDALAVAFGRRAPLRLDVGVGNGDATRAWAADHPDHDVVAFELHRPGIAHLLRHLDDDGPTNVRVVDGDITALLDRFGPGSLDEVRVLFPDPWHKKRHHKRRLVDAAFVHELVDRLAVGGRLHLATDWLDYADAMRIAIAADDRLRPGVDHDDGPAVDDTGEEIDAPTRWRTDRPPRPTTAYEHRGRAADRPITDLVATRTT